MQQHSSSAVYYTTPPPDNSSTIVLWLLFTDVDAATYQVRAVWPCNTPTHIINRSSWGHYNHDQFGSELDEVVVEKIAVWCDETLHTSEDARLEQMLWDCKRIGLSVNGGCIRSGDQ
jgi:hypothetical protein